MAITNIGYDGSVTEAQWAKLIPAAGSSQYGVAGASDWKVTAHPSLMYGINIAVGSGWGHGVYTTSDTVVPLQGISVTTGTRWDLVVARRNWAGAGGSTTFAIISGTTTKAIPARNTNPGVIDEQPIALVQFASGFQAPQAIVDLRVWPGTGGGMYAADLLARNYNTLPGTRLVIGDQDWMSTINSGGSQTWTQLGQASAIQLFGFGSTLSGGTPPAGTQFLVQSGTTSATADGSGYGRITWPVPFPNGLLTVIASNGDDWVGGGSGGGAVMFSGAGNAAIWGGPGLGDKNSWVYAVLSQNTSSMFFGRYGNKVHRINWTAIGW
jgi:hypothetical protein